MTKVIEKLNKLSQQELDAICKEIKEKGWINKGLTPHATPLEKSKYEICQNILRYKRENNLNKKELAQRIKIKSAKLNHLLFCHIEHFTLDELVLYASELFSPFQIGIIEVKNKGYLRKGNKTDKIQSIFSH